MKRIFFFWVSLVLLVSSCHWNPVSLWSDGDDTSEVKIHRYDRIVDEFVSLNSFSSLQRMNMEYPAATRLLIEDVLDIGSVEDAHIEQRLRRFYLDSTMQVLLEDVHSRYANLDAEEKELSSVFRQVKKADPDFMIPLVYTQISGLNQSVIVGDSILGISLDKYLGSDYPLYRKYYHSFQCRVMDRDRLVPDALFYYLSHEYSQPAGRLRTLCDYALDYAKIHWVIARFRGVSLAGEAGFDAQQVEEFRRSERTAWEWMAENGAWESTDRSLVRNFTAPQGNPPCADDCPPQIGLWLALQVVDHYMKGHPEVTAGQLLRMRDYNAIFCESGFSPAPTQ